MDFGTQLETVVEEHVIGAGDQVMLVQNVGHEQLDDILFSPPTPGSRVRKCRFCDEHFLSEKTRQKHEQGHTGMTPIGLFKW